MTITETRPEEAAGAEASGPSPAQGATQPSGLHDWLTTADPTKISRLYIVTSMLMLLGMLGIGALLGLERMDGGGAQIVPLDSVAQLYSLYGYGLVFGAALPLLFGLALAVVPLQVGARTVAFPRAAAASYWTWLFGIGVMIAAYAINGGPGGGDSDGVSLFLVALGVVILALCTLAVCVATTVLTLRAPGMTLNWVPFFSWSAMVGGVMVLLTLPVLLGNVVLLWADHRYARATFGGNLGVGAGLDWVLRQPQVYVTAVLALGFIADAVPVFARARQRLVRPLLVVIGLFGAVGFGAFAQPFFHADVRFELVFIVLSLVAVVPLLALLVFSGLTLRSGGKINPGSPLVWALVAGLMGFVAVAVGALTPIRDLELQGTVYELSQFTYTVVGLAVLGGLGALAYWGPKLWGRRLPEGPSRGLAVLALLGVVLTAFPDVILGFQDQPYGEVNWTETFDLQQVVNIVHGVGAILLFLVVALFALVVIQGFARGQRAGDDPWDGHTLEWATSSPPPVGNFAEPPAEVTSDRPLLDRKEQS